MTYIDHANAFINEFTPYFKMLYKHNSPTPRRLEKLISRFNTVHRRGYVVSWGCSRMVIIADDFVIKMDYDGWGAGFAGGVQDEIEAFHFASEAGFEHLFAKPTPFYYNEHLMTIMPRIKNIDVNKEISEYEDELYTLDFDFLNDYFYDLHGGNFGFDENGNLIVFDYACYRIEEEKEE